MERVRAAIFESSIVMKKSKPNAIRVQASGGTYSVICESGVLRRIQRELDSVGSCSSVHIVTSPKVWRVMGPRLRAGFSKKGMPQVHVFNDAESLKNMQSVESISRSLVRAGADRKALVVAVGGGVIGDVAGFAAASYLRGVALVQVPTTLVAQVDSAVGGKTGVNLPEGKNLVGAFYPPRLVLVDPSALETLPDREFRGGLAEVIKYGVIADGKLFSFLEENIEKILKRDAAALHHIIRRSIEIKAQVVSKDERESGLREILNFGHTFGHALETKTRYKRFQHGEAVAWGMMCAAMLGHEFLKAPANDVARIVSLVRKIGPLPAWPRIAERQLVEAMRADKKAHKGKLRFVLSPKLGRAATYESIPEKLVIEVLKFAPQLLQTRQKGKRDD
jgi:3-dehydroquinate synthase